MKGLRRSGSRLAFIAPAAIVLGLLVLYPLYILVQMSVRNVSIFNINKAWPYVGVHNFAFELGSSDFRNALLHTLIYTVFVLVVGLFGGLGAALVLQAPGFASRVLATLLLFIWSMPPVVNGSLWKFLLGGNGVVNTIIQTLHLSHGPVLWLVDSRTALLAVAYVNTWVAIPFIALILRAALLDVPQELLEAAEVDGATNNQKFRHITLPMIAPAILIVGLLIAINAFRSFDYVYVMTGGGPGILTTTLPYLSYSLSFVTFRFDFGSAIAVLAIVIVLPLALAYMRATMRLAGHAS